jgi:hypothetical protein
MKLLVLSIVSGILAGCASGPAPITAAQRAARHVKTLQDAGLQYYWKCDELPGLLSVGEKIDRTYLIDENFYCLTTRNRLIAIDAARGILRWTKWVHVAKPGVKVYDPVHAKNVMIPRIPPTRKEILQPKDRIGRKIKAFNAVIISTRTDALLIDRANGDEIRHIQYNFAAGASAGVCSDGRLLFVPDARGWYHAILLHQMLENWTLSVEGAITLPPRYVDDKVIVVSDKGRVQVASTFETRKKIWTRAIGTAIGAPVLATRDQLLVPGMDRRLHAFDPTTGRKLWEPFDCKKPLKDVPQTSEISAFQYARGGEFYALAVVTGKLRWSLPDARKVLAAMNRNVYLQDNRNRILVVDEILGETNASVQMPPSDLLTANTTAPGIYGASRSGKVYCLRSIDAGHITAEMLRKKN